MKNKTRTLAAAVSFFLLSAAAGLSANRLIESDWDVRWTPKINHQIEWLQAESVEYTLTLTLDSAAYEFSTNSIIVWEISPGETYSNLSAYATGTVISATNGTVQFLIPPEKSNLLVGNYNGFIRLFVYAGTNLTENVILQRQNIDVGWSPAGLELSNFSLDPGFYTRTDIDGFFATASNTQHAVNTNFETRISTLESSPAVWNTVTNKADQSALDALAGTVGTNSAARTNHAARLTVLEASTSTWNTVTANTATLTNHTARIIALETPVLFSGTGSTGMVTSVIADAGKYLKADGTWDTITATATNATSWQIDGTNVAIMVPSTGLLFNPADNTVSVTGKASQADFLPVSNAAAAAAHTVIINGTTNTAASGVINLGSTSGSAVPSVYAVFNGSSDYVSLTGSGATWVYDSNFVITFTGDLLKRSAVQDLLGNRISSTATGPFGLYIGSDNKLNLHTRYTGDNRTAYVLAANWTEGWQTLTVTKTGTNVVFESDGNVLTSAGSAMNSLDTSINLLRIGTDVDGLCFYTGRVSSVRFDATANTAKSFELVFNAGTGTNINDTINAFDGVVNTASLPAFWNWASTANLYTPTGSTAVGISGNIVLSTGTNRYLYWYSPTAVSGTKTGIWLRAAGETF